MRRRYVLLEVQRGSEVCAFPPSRRVSLKNGQRTTDGMDRMTKESKELAELSLGITMIVVSICSYFIEIPTHVMSLLNSG